MNYYYSAKTGGFYNDLLINDYGNDWPKDALLISLEAYERLMEASNNKEIIIADKNGYPIAIEAPLPTKEQQQHENKNKISEFISRSSNDISRYQDAIAFDGGTEKENAMLILLKQYRVALGRVDVSLGGELNLPDYPSS